MRPSRPGAFQAAFPAALALAAALLAPAAACARDPAPLVATERAFAADTARDGVEASFLRWSAPEAVVLAPDPVPARALYARRPDGKGRALAWRPAFAGLAASGDLGFTAGPYTVGGAARGAYVTVWARQADGAWRWIYDGGMENPAPAEKPRAAAALRAASGDPTPANEARLGVRAAESALAAGAATDLAEAYRGMLASDAWVQGPSRPPAHSGKAVARELAARPQKVRFRPLGGRASAAGDLVWTYGEASWDGGRGHYVRIWQHRDGWRLVFDQLTASP